MEPVTIAIDPTTLLLLALFVVQWVRSERRSVSRDDLATIVERIVREQTEPSQHLVAGLQRLAQLSSEPTIDQDLDQ